MVDTLANLTGVGVTALVGIGLFIVVAGAVVGLVAGIRRG